MRGLKRSPAGDPSGMSTDAPDHPQDRSEDEQERLNRQMIELLNELRVAMPGVQVLFGFLLTVPFQQRFQRVNEFQETVYFVTLIAAAVATAFLIAPSAYHRLMLEQHDKPNIIRIGTGQMIAGLCALALAMNGAVLLVTDVLFEASTVTVTLVLLASLYLTLWFGFPLVRRAQK
jgi:membrane-bound acyltransferase YfiQ involved in biofilm formation